MLSGSYRDEAEDIAKFLDYVVKKVKVPLMIDSTDSKVIELALKFSQGKAIINSINLEDGKNDLKMWPLSFATYGAAIVVEPLMNREWP